MQLMVASTNREGHSIHGATFPSHRRVQMTLFSPSQSSHPDLAPRMHPPRLSVTRPHMTTETPPMTHLRAVKKGNAENKKNAREGKIVIAHPVSRHIFLFCDIPIALILPTPSRPRSRSS